MWKVLLSDGTTTRVWSKREHIATDAEEMASQRSNYCKRCILVSRVESEGAQDAPLCVLVFYASRAQRDEAAKHALQVYLREMIESEELFYINASAEDACIEETLRCLPAKSCARQGITVILRLK